MVPHNHKVLIPIVLLGDGGIAAGLRVGQFVVVGGRSDEAVGGTAIHVADPALPGLY